MLQSLCRILKFLDQSKYRHTASRAGHQNLYTSLSRTSSEDLRGVSSIQLEAEHGIGPAPISKSKAGSLQGMLKAGIS